MSVRAMSAVWDHSTATGSARLVLLAIADCCNDEMTAFPSLDTIARKAKVDRRTVSRCVADLEQAGELVRVHRGGRVTRGGKSNTYRVMVTQGQDAITTPLPEVGAPCPRDSSPLGASDPELGASRPEVGAPRPSNHQNRQNRQVNARRTPKDPPAGFDAWWAMYPRKKGKPKAERAYRTATTGRDRATPAVLLVRLKRAVDHWERSGTADQFIPYPASWLNDRRWEDEDVATEAKPNLEPSENFRLPQL